MHERFRHLVQQSWKRFIHGSHAFQLVRKIDFLKKEIKNWKKSCYNKEFHDIDTMKSELI